METLEKQISIELNKKTEKINNISHGKVVFIIQDKKLTRVEVLDGWIPDRK